MFTSSPELWWAVVVSTIVFLILGVGIVVIIVQNQRRHISELPFFLSGQKTLAGAANTDKVIGRSILNFIKPERRKAVKKQIREKLLQGNDVSITEETITRLDGTEIEIELVAIPIVYRGKRAVQMVIRDVTEQKRVQEE